MRNLHGILGIVVSLLMTAGLIGCPPGSDSGNSGGNQNTTDTTPPAVSSRVPVNNATDVAVNTPIVARFSEAMNASTVNASTFLVSDSSGTIAGAVVCSGSTATFTPSSNLATGATYTVTITTGARDQAGNALAFDYVWHFTTGTLKAWSQMVLLDNLTAAAGAPAVAADRLNNGSGDGTVIVAWAQSDGDQESIFASRFNGSTWSTPVTIETQSTGGFSGSAYSPRVAMNQYGQAVVLWGYSDGPGNYRIWSNEYSGGWGTERHISSTSGNANSHQVTFDVNGDDIIALWSQYQSGNNQSNYYILQRQHHHVSCLNNPSCVITDPNAIGWQSMSLFAPPYDIGDAGEPQIAAWGNKNAVAVWVQNVPSVGNRTYANIATSGTWTTKQQINPQAVYDAAAPVVAVDNSGNALAVWLEWAPGRKTLMASRYSLGTWSTPTQIDDPNGSNAGDWDPPRQQVVMDSSGNAIIVWQQENANRTAYNILARQCPAGPLSGCGSPVLLETSAGYADFPQVAVAPNGDAIAVWKQEDGAARRIYANHYSAASDSWNVTATLIGGADSTRGEGPQIAIDGSGRATVVWTEVEGGQYNIRAVRYE